MPLWTKQQFHVKQWRLAAASTGSAGTAWPCHAAPLRECFECTNWLMFPAAWDTFDELSDMRTSHNVSCFWRMCAPSQRLTENCSFFCVRSRPKRSSVLETSSSLLEMRNITESPLCHYFIPPIQTAVGVIHARTWRNTLSFKKKAEEDRFVGKPKYFPRSFSLCLILCFKLFKCTQWPWNKIN